MTRESTVIHGRARTAAGADIHFVETGNPAGEPVLFVHGISQSWRSWQKQLGDTSLSARFRLIALDLRGHGASQGTGSAGENEIAAVVAACGLTEMTLVGWSYGGAVVLDYLHVGGGLNVATGVVLVATSPVVQPPGTPHVGADSIFTPRAVAALMQTTPAVPHSNAAADIESGLKTFMEICLADGTGRPVATEAEVAAIVSSNPPVEPDVRLSLMTRTFDYRGFLAELPRRAQQRVTVITPMGDQVLRSAHTRTLWPTGGINHVPIGGEGHLCFWRAPDDFRQTLLTAMRAARLSA